MIDYLDLVEEHKEKSSMSLFEKVRVMSNRARDLYAGKTSKAAQQLEGCKPVTIAQYELLKGYIEPEIQTEEKKEEELSDNLTID